MHPRRRTAIAAAAALLAFAATTSGCTRGSAATSPLTADCPAALAKAKGNVAQAMNTTTSWDGPTSGPRAVSNRTIAFVAQTMINPGVAGVTQGVKEAAKAIGWNVKVIDGQGPPAGIQAAFSQAINLNPAGIVVGAFDPAVTSQQIAQANARNIPLIGWHAVDSPGPSKHPKLFTNITTKVEDVAKISADWIIAHSQGDAGVVIFTDASVPFARNKSELIRKELATCSSVSLLSYENLPITDTTSRVPQAVSSLLARFQDEWTYSVAINDVYFADAAAPLQAAGKQGDGPPFNIGAGDGDPSAFQRINHQRYQAATVPEPILEQGWQIIDEFNRAFSTAPASGYVAPVHISTAPNSKGATSWDPTGYREAYRKMWGR
ncbi:sugar ABC transporter substrate-binding protein [Streptomyces sp. WM4235]|uniref:substrate-binding domain-containing protein n=1 Tax=Streptomyces sp. WM4235 TaxID=1415551 RepID=UPI0006B03097|nr:substrate-binding domain-containing protein [Streptomyces sp. WM4235]KOU40486.1 sugar ABC transporter substrate-binding protein [Streptomyces sp. WM4235]